MVDKERREGPEQTTSSAEELYRIAAVNARNAGREDLADFLDSRARKERLVVDLSSAAEDVRVAERAMEGILTELKGGTTDGKSLGTPLTPYIRKAEKVEEVGNVIRIITGVTELAVNPDRSDISTATSPLGIKISKLNYSTHTARFFAKRSVDVGSTGDATPSKVTPPSGDRRPRGRRHRRR